MALDLQNQSRIKCFHMVYSSYEGVIRVIWKRRNESNNDFCYSVGY